MFYYSADNQMYKDGKPCYGILPNNRPSSLLRPSVIRSASTYFVNTVPSGWHFSYMGSDQQRELKIKSFGHQEFNNSEILSQLSSRCKTRQDPFARDGITFCSYELSLLPNLMLDNPRFRSFFLPDSVTENQSINVSSANTNNLTFLG